jgi:hypothetical protein
VAWTLLLRRVMAASAGLVTTPLFLAHRGLWAERAEMNGAQAFRRAREAGFGVETDVRDLGGELVVSHDPPRPGAMPLEAFLDLFQRAGPELPVAVDVKADGIDALLAAALRRRGLERWFAFDMSVPDALRYARAGLPFFTRQSEHEPSPALYEAARGVWVDAFERDWVEREVVAGHLAAGKSVALVSPELHGRPPEPFWSALAAWCAGGFRATAGAELFLCTDHPARARDALSVPRREVGRG